MTISMTTIRNRAPNTAPMTKPASFPFSSLSPDMVTGFWVVVVMERDLFSHLWIKTSFSTSTIQNFIYSSDTSCYCDWHRYAQSGHKGQWLTRSWFGGWSSFPQIFALWNCTRAKVLSDCYFSFGIWSRGSSKIWYCFSLADRKKICTLAEKKFEVAIEVKFQTERPSIMLTKHDYIKCKRREPRETMGVALCKRILLVIEIK